METYISIPYLIITALLNYFILYYIVNTKKSLYKILINVWVGLLVGFIYIKFIDIDIEKLFTSFTLSVVLYEWVLKYVLKTLNITIDNNKGVQL